MSDLSHCRGVLFDLDGTLVDTAPDLVFALNQTLGHFGGAPVPYEQARRQVSHGAMALIRFGFGMEPEDAGFEDRRQHLLQVYRDNLCRETELFAGMAQLLTQLEHQGRPWGIVTNKPGYLTDPLVEALGLRSPAIVSGDTCANKKPHPEPILHACELLGVKPAESVYIGDAARDIEAGRAAGTITVAAGFGYLLEGERAEDWDADHVANEPGEIRTLLGA